MADEFELVAILSVNSHCDFVRVWTNFNFESLVFGIADKSANQNLWMELRVEAGVLLRVRVEDFDLSFLLDVNGVAGSVAGSFDGVVVDFLVAFGHVGFLGVVSVLV